MVAAADSDRLSTETHAANIQSLTWTGDLSDPGGFIGQLDEWGIESVDLVAGGPPCQPFSNAGASKIGHLVKTGHRQARDERADLWRSFFSIVDRSKPSAMLFENVPNFAQAQGGALLIALMDELKHRGYAGPRGGARCVEVSSSTAQVKTLRGGNRRGCEIRLAQAYRKTSSRSAGHRRPAGGSGRFTGGDPPVSWTCNHAAWKIT